MISNRSRARSAAVVIAAGAVLGLACRRSSENPAASGSGAEKPPAASAPVEAADGARNAAPAAPASPARRVLWIGLDGIDREHLDSLAAAGTMPNWKRLSAEGFGARLESFEPMLSPILWTTQETGVGPDVHRILDFQELDPATGLLGPVSEGSRKSPAIWNIASDAGRKVGVVGFWATHPAEIINGFFLSNRIDASRAELVPGGVAFPASLTDTVRRVVSRETAIPRSDLAPYFGGAMPPASPAVEEKLKSLTDLLASTRITQRLARELYDRELPDFLAVYFEGTDSVGHLFAPFAPPKMSCVSDGDFASFHLIPQTYFAAIDAILGQWMRRAREDHAVLVVTSDHGFRWGADRNCQSASTDEATAAQWHRTPGVFAAWGPGVLSRPPSSSPAATQFDVAPTLLALLGLPADRKMPGRILPVLPAMAVVPPRDLYPGMSVKTVASQPLDPRSADEYARKLAALGYISASPGAAAAAENTAAAGLTKGGWNNLGVYLRFTANDEKGARAAWVEAVRLDPAYHSPLFNLARLEKDRGNFAEASRWLLRAVAAGHPDPEATVSRWAGDFSRTDARAAAALLRDAYTAHPESAGYAREYALLLSRSGRCREAVAVIAPLEQSDRVENLNAAAAVEVCLDRPEVIRRLLERSLAADPNQPRVRDALASLPR